LKNGCIAEIARTCGSVFRGRIVEGETDGAVRRVVRPAKNSESEKACQANGGSLGKKARVVVYLRKIDPMND